ncbi:MAG: type II secretion system F family protein [Lachnospiraceae bacterium]
MNKKEYILFLIKGISICGMVSYLFYSSILPMIFTPIFLIYYKRTCENQKSKKRDRETITEFKEWIRIVNINLHAGYSLENAFLESRKELIILFGQNSIMAKEIKIMKKGLHFNKSLEEILKKLSENTKLEEVEEFVEIIAVAKKTGGPIHEIMERTIQVIDEKLQLKEEIETIIHGKKVELLVMKCIPFFIIFYIRITSTGYFDPLYHNLNGILIMTSCLLIYVIAIYVAKNIVKIEL